MTTRSYVHRDDRHLGDACHLSYTHGRSCGYVGCPIEYGFTGVHKRLSLIRGFADWRDKRVLDVGCGTGAYTLEIAREAATVWGVDVTRDFLQVFAHRLRNLRGMCNVHLVEGESEQLPFDDGGFDVIVCIETLEHVRDERQTLQEMHRVLKEDGTLVLTLPNKRYIFEAHGLRHLRYSQFYPCASWLPKRLHARLANARIYTERDITALLSETGWQDVRFDWLLPPLDQLRVAWLRDLLRRATAKLERTRLRKFGVSLIVAANKAV